MGESKQPRLDDQIYELIKENKLTRCEAWGILESVKYRIAMEIHEKRSPHGETFHLALPVGM